MTKKPVLVTSILLLMLVLATADIVLVEKNLLADWREAALQTTTVEPDILETSTHDDPQVDGVVKITEPSVFKVTTILGFEIKATAEATLISQIVPTEVAQAQSAVLLRNSDRIGIISWVDSPEVKLYFLALKEALHATFSPQIQDLVDETQQREGKPTRNLLTFKDPLISEERIVFIRIRERLYELHVADGMDEVMFELVEALTN